MSPRSPGDLSVLAPGTTQLVGGRVVRVADGTLSLADALGAIEVELSVGVEAGDLLLVEGTWTGDRLVAATVVSTSRPTAFGKAGGDAGRLLFGGVGRGLLARARALAAVRSLLAERGFLEVDTPSLVPSPGLDLHLEAVGCEGGGFLVTSPEYQMKRLLAGGLPRVFQLARCFRKGERGRLHNPEFLMLEWYRSFEGYGAVMRDTEAIVRAVAVALRGEPVLEAEGRRIDASGPFARVTVAEAFERFAGETVDRMLSMADRDEDAYFRVMVDTIEPALASLGSPVFLCDYPASQASLARRKPDDGRFCERFELFAGGVELCNGFGELVDPVEQRARLEHDQAERRRRGMPIYPIDERFLAALDEGLPPCAGNALGLDRLVALALGAPSIAAVQAFPHDAL